MPYFPKNALEEFFRQEVPFMMFISGILFILFFLILFNFLLEINKKFGPENLWRMFSGRYHTPVVEERIFMFIDLKSSTSYAEQLGHFKYSQLIQLCFRHLNSVMEDSNGEIYQYVGDEAVITWDARYQVNFDNCINFFFAFKNKIEEERVNYESKFGLVPEFKAGVNCGSVTAAEVGTIKREIAYHGDVLNTAARIQEQCNTLKEKLLVSGGFLSEIGDDHGYHSIPLGATELKGKDEPVNIFAIREQAVKEVMG
jgi:adenylate cyclase